MSDEMRYCACDEAETELLREPAEAESADTEHDADCTEIEHEADNADTGHDESAPEKKSADEYIRQIEELGERLRAAEEERAARERELLCLSLLSEAGLPAELAAAVTASEDMAHTVELIRDTVQSRVESELSLRCRTSPPLAAGRPVLTRDELKRIPVAELQRLRDTGVLLG